MPGTNSAGFVRRPFRGKQKKKEKKHYAHVCERYLYNKCVDMPEVPERKRRRTQTQWLRRRQLGYMVMIIIVYNIRMVRASWVKKKWAEDVYRSCVYRRCVVFASVFALPRHNTVVK